MCFKVPKTYSVCSSVSTVTKYSYMCVVNLSLVMCSVRFSQIKHYSENCKKEKYFTNFTISKSRTNLHELNL